MSTRQRRRKTRAYKESGDGKQWLMVLAGAACLIGIVSAGAYHFLNKPKGIDAQTLCPAEGPLGHVVVLVDQTDPYTFIQSEAFKRHFKNLAKDEVPPGYMLSVFALGESFEAGAKPLYERCNPGSSEGKSKFDVNIQRLERRYNQEYLAPISEFAESLVSTGKAKQSPVLEMIQLAAINGFMASDVNGPRKLIIFSDMLHNTQDFSMFRGGIPEYETYSSQSYAQKSRADLQGVRVELNVLIQYPELQTRKQAVFWEKYFDDMGATLAKFRPVEG